MTRIHFTGFEIAAPFAFCVVPTQGEWWRATDEDSQRFLLSVVPTPHQRHVSRKKFPWRFRSPSPAVSFWEMLELIERQQWQQREAQVVAGREKEGLAEFCVPTTETLLLQIYHWEPGRLEAEWTLHQLRRATAAAPSISFLLQGAQIDQSSCFMSQKPKS